jgi:hypothetical protein
MGDRTKCWFSNGTGNATWSVSARPFRETCRAFLWLGSHAPPLTRDRVSALGRESAHRAALARHSSSTRLRREAREGMTIR